MHKRLLSTLSRRTSQENGVNGTNQDSPEAAVVRGVRLFCESGGPNNPGDEVLHLPTIVESAESSPVAAAEAAKTIRKFLSKENYQRAYVQYNAVMLVRILTDNPGKVFTRNLEGKFVATVKDLLRDGRDMSVQQILRETLDSFETTKKNDETLSGLIEMWKKEKDKMVKRSSVVPSQGPVQHGPPGNFAQQQAQQQNYFARPHRPRNALPPPAELAQRIEEARTSAKLLSQVVGTTPAGEIIGNELIKEFVERCQSASRSVQAYIHADNPAPDEDTLLTLIETNDQLATSISRYQRALLEARKRFGIPSPHPTPPALPPSSSRPTASGALDTPPSEFAAPPPGPPPARRPLNGQANQDQNPFGDHNEAAHPGMADLQAPLQPQMYGLPPQSIGQQHAPGLSNERSMSVGSEEVEVQPPPQTTGKPRYRF